MQPTPQVQYFYFVAFQRFRKELEEMDAKRLRRTSVLAMINKHLLAVLDEMDNPSHPRGSPPRDHRGGHDGTKRKV